MAWTERQRAMLREMGIRDWSPHGSTEVAGDAIADAVGDGLGDTAERGDGPRSEPLATLSATTSAVAPAVTVPPVAPASFEISTSPDHAVTGLDAVARLDWAQLRDKVAGCTACRLCESRRQTVFGAGDTRAHWMIVGEAPGEQEDRQGEPFVGKSGQLLDNMLRALGLTRGEAAPEQQVYIANTIKCRPPGNRNPEPDELERCEAHLVRQLELLQPRIIIAMGRFAVQSLLRSSEPVGRLRGRVHRYHRVPLIVTYHPAYLLRNCDDKAKAWDDLCLARETMQAERAEADPVAQAG